MGKKATSLVGTAEITAGSAQAMSAGCQSVDNLTTTAPQNNLKGSVNKGGGGGARRSGCGGRANPAPCKKKSKSCGGGGGGCGGKKKKKPEEKPFNVIFKDFYGKCVGEVQQVPKGEPAEAPWYDDAGAKEHPQGNVPGYTFDRWKENFSQVESDMQVNPVYIKDLEEFSPDNDLIDKEAVDQINQFVDGCIDAYNAEIDTCVKDIDTCTFLICGEHIDQNTRNASILTDGIMNVLAEHEHECIDDASYQNIKKCILNIQSCYIFQTRMLFNNEFMECNGKIDEYNKNLWNCMVNGESVPEKILEYKDDFDTRIYDIDMTNKETYKEFITCFNLYIDDLNKCFPTDILEHV